MIIKAWNSYDMGVLQVNRNALKSIEKEIREKFTKEQIRELRQMAKEFGEQRSLEYAHNLKRGWEKKLLNEGRVLDRRGTEITTVQQVKDIFRRDGQIQFFAYNKGKSLKVIDSLKKPAHLCWR